MLSRLFRMSLAVAWLLFTSVIVPAHTRGYITWGKAEAPENCGSCCSSKPVGKSSQPPTQEEKKRCAVCFTVALFDAPPAFVIWADYLAEARCVTIARRATPDFKFIPLTYQSRAPPI